MVTMAGARVQAVPRPATGGIFIGLGSNLGDRAGHIRGALGELDASGLVRVARCSRLLETEPEGCEAGAPRFVNAVAEVDTALEPRALLAVLLRIEETHGRVRSRRNAARTLDLDLLIYRDRVIAEPDLVVPHPRMWERTFVMIPLHEIAPAELLSSLRARLNGGAEPGVSASAGAGEGA